MIYSHFYSSAFFSFFRKLFFSGNYAIQTLKHDSQINLIRQQKIFLFVLYLHVLYVKILLYYV